MGFRGDSPILLPGDNKLRLRKVAARVAPEDWMRLEAVTSSLSEEGAGLIVGLLRARNNGAILRDESPLPKERNLFYESVAAVNRAFRRGGLPYRLARDRDAKGRLIFFTLRLWEIA